MEKNIAPAASHLFAFAFRTHTARGGGGGEEEGKTVTTLLEVLLRLVAPSSSSSALASSCHGGAPPVTDAATQSKEGSAVALPSCENAGTAQQTPELKQEPQQVKVKSEAPVVETTEGKLWRE